VNATYRQSRTRGISKAHLTRVTSPGESERNASHHSRHRKRKSHRASSHCFERDLHRTSQRFRLAAVPLTPEIPPGEPEKQKQDLLLEDDEKSLYVPSQSKKEPWSAGPAPDVQTQNQFGDKSKGYMQQKGAKLGERRNNNLEEENRQRQNEKMSTASQRRRGSKKSPATMPAPLTAQNLKACQRGFVEAGAPSTLNRMLGDQTRTYIEGMTPDREVGKMETKREIKSRRRARH
jgi:hypothetical protein